MESSILRIFGMMSSIFNKDSITREVWLFVMLKTDNIITWNLRNNVVNPTKGALHEYLDEIFEDGRRYPID
jgi:hypothetical protein